ncbi:MAG: T9SS type A sorting domain-containing protein [Bacteroidia bacterium]|nr:T9SS type A sorting domain-containing protein [Bacteroidia bacterium]
MMFKVDYSKPYNFATDNHTCPTGNCSDLTFNLPSVTVGYGAFVLEYGTDERIFAATDVGVFVSDRTSRQGPLSGVWTNITDNLPHVPCSNLEVNYDANLLRIMLNGRGVWERALDCPATANLNITTNSADYNAASASLTSSANITGNANLVQYRAGSTVFLTNGFRSNTNFHAYIRPCGNAQSSPGMYMKLANPDVTEKNTETDLEKTFAAYPNPANSYIAVELPDNTTLNYRISDLMGNITSSGQTSSGIIDVSQLANGIYFLLINSNTYRICVIH